SFCALAGRLYQKIQHCLLYQGRSLQGQGSRDPIGSYGGLGRARPIRGSSSEMKTMKKPLHPPAPGVVAPARPEPAGPSSSPVGRAPSRGNNSTTQRASRTLNTRGQRRAIVERNTTESQIRIALGLDGTGIRRIPTTIP